MYNDNGPPPIVRGLAPNWLKEEVAEGRLKPLCAKSPDIEVQPGRHSALTDADIRLIFRICVAAPRLAYHVKSLRATS